MSSKQLVQQFLGQWKEAAQERAIARGVPEHLARNRRWGQFVNLFPTDEGTFAFVGFGSDDTVLAEWTLDQIEQAISWFAPSEPGTANRIWSSPAHKVSSHDFSQPVGDFFFTGGYTTYLGSRCASLEWYQTRQDKINKYNVNVERTYVLLHLDGTVSLPAESGAHTPHTLALLDDLGIMVVDEKRPTNAEEAFEAHKHQFIVSHAPSPERQRRLAEELFRRRSSPEVD